MATETMSFTMIHRGGKKFLLMFVFDNSLLKIRCIPLLRSAEASPRLMHDALPRAVSFFS